MSQDELSRGEENKSFHDSLNYVTAAPDTGDGCELIAEYLHRSDRLRRHERLFFKRLCFTNKPRPLPAQLIRQHCDTVVHESLALELSKSILYDNGESIDLKNLKSLNSHGDSKQYSQDSLWNGKPQQYFESMIMDDLDGMIGFVSSKEDYESDSLAQ